MFAVYKDNLEIALKQIEIIEKLVNTESIDIEIKIDNKATGYEHSVRKPGNRVYTEPLLTKKRNLINKDVH